MSTATRHLSVEDYIGLVRDGTVDSDDRVELLNGEVVEKMARHPPHILATKKTVKALTHARLAGWSIIKGDPVRLLDSVPEPDVAVVRGDDDDYAQSYPGPAEIGLIIEVSGSSLDRDRTLKLPAYARSCLAIYWIINLFDHCLEVYSGPAGSEYRSHQILGPDDEVSLILDGREVARLRVRDLLP